MLAFALCPSSFVPFFLLLVLLLAFGRPNTRFTQGNSQATQVQQVVLGPYEGTVSSRCSSPACKRFGASLAAAAKGAVVSAEALVCIVCSCPLQEMTISAFCLYRTGLQVRKEWLSVLPESIFGFQ